MLFPTLPMVMVVVVVSQVSQRTAFELILCLSVHVTFIPGKRQRLFAPLLFKILTVQPTLKAYRVLRCLPMYQRGHNLKTEFSFNKNRAYDFQKIVLGYQLVLYEYFSVQYMTCCLYTTLLSSLKTTRASQLNTCMFFSNG